MGESAPVIRIRPPGRRVPVDWAELWDHRELLRVIVGRDLVARYKQSLFGIAWFAIQPIITALIFSFVFGRLVGVGTDGAPPFLFFFSAVVGWTLFSASVNAAVNSLVVNANLLKKVYFPRLMLPMSAVLGSAADAGVSTTILLLAVLVLGEFTAGLLLLPVYATLAIALALGLGFWASSLNVQYRDVGKSMQFVLQVWMYLCPVAYPLEVVPESMRWIYLWNPMAVVVHGWRRCILGLEQPPASSVTLAAATAAMVLVTGIYFFKRREAVFADIV
jgi:lipopolysaccharide transport system permease protein